MVVKMRRCCGEKLRESARTHRELCDELRTTSCAIYTNDAFVAREKTVYMSGLHREYPVMSEVYQFSCSTRANAVQIDRRTLSCQETLREAGRGGQRDGA